MSDCCYIVLYLTCVNFCRLSSAGLAGDGEDNEGVLVCQQCRPTHRSPNQENPLSAQPTGGNQDVDTTTKHTHTHL